MKQRARNAEAKSRDGRRIMPLGSKRAAPVVRSGQEVARRRAGNLLQGQQGRIALRPCISIRIVLRV